MAIATINPATVAEALQCATGKVEVVAVDSCGYGTVVIPMTHS